MTVEDFLNRVEEEIRAVIPPDIRITDIEFEGAELVIYTKDPEKFAEQNEIVKQLAKKLQKRIVVRPDPDVLEDMEKAVSDDPGSALLKRLDSMICVLGDFNENLGEMEGGFGLMPYSVDLGKFLWWWRKILELKEPGARMKELDRLVLRRLPYEHPIALMTCRILDNMTNGAADLEEGSNEG